MKRFEYKRELVDATISIDDATVHMNSLGIQGWELVHLNDKSAYVPGQGEMVIAWFKREIE